ncbi:hypothetical protein BSK60_02130 [Paenibacillus odorifer]|nr:hypothetical protein BSK60_02130 [Paenibacillus odorifer]
MNSGSLRLYLSSLGLTLLYYPGQSADKRISVFKVLLTPGVIPILVVVLAWMLAHNILYIYISPFLGHSCFSCFLLCLLPGVLKGMGFVHPRSIK